jgi:D-beta-D-heptose 7-phosphate kinase/D-beta-D-heptose 1-phosphate adenosyltransferase
MIGRAAQRHPCQIMRIDEEITDSISKEAESQLVAAIDRKLPFVQLVLISDYAKGVCTTGLLRKVIEDCRASNIPVLVDPARGSDLEWYRGATLLKPNRVEAALGTGTEITTPLDAIRVATGLVNTLQVGSVVITLDSDGMVFAGVDNVGEHIPTTPQQVYDITGAGDMALVMLGVSIASGISLPLAVRLANVASGLEVQHYGVVPVSRGELREAVTRQLSSSHCKKATLLEAGCLADRYRSEGRRIVLTNGCFDLLHSGHLQCLQQAAGFGDILFVAVNSDVSVRRLKGPSRPIYDETDRVHLLSALECVTHVILYDENTPHRVIERIRPDVLAKGGTYREEEIVGREVVLAYGGQVRLTRTMHGRSTTSIIAQCQSLCDKSRPLIAGSVSQPSQTVLPIEPSASN